MHTDYSGQTQFLPDEIEINLKITGKKAKELAVRNLPGETVTLTLGDGEVTVEEAAEVIAAALLKPVEEWCSKVTGTAEVKINDGQSK